MYFPIGTHAVLYLLLNLWIQVQATVDSQKLTSGRQSPPSFKAPSANVPATHILPLSGKVGISQSADYLQSIRSGNHVNGVYGLTSVIFVAGSVVFSASIDFGTQSFQASIDTGSSDTWLVGKNFQCNDQTTGAQKPKSACMLGPLYTISSTFKRIPDQHFTANYADESFYTGIVGNETVTVAGITVKNQEVAVVDQVASSGDGVTSGLLGLSFRSSTSVYTGTNLSINKKHVEYDPVFISMYTRGYTLPLFSLGIERFTAKNGTTSGGLLAIGGLPPIPFYPLFASSPFQLLTVDNNPVPVAYSPTANPNQPYTFYVIVINGLTYERSNETNWSHPSFPNPLEPPSNASHIQVVIDSGISLIYLFTGIANAVNALFDPPAVFEETLGVYAVKCSAKAPEFGVEIGGQTFFVSDIGLGKGFCDTGINDADHGVSILGAVFLKNVLAIFDVGAGEMRFAAREFY